MSNDEFTTWARRLFVAFPSLWDWLQSNSPDPKETQAIWRQALLPYTAAECQSVVDRWSTGALEPFAAYERDKVHLLVRAVVEGDRSKAERRRRKAENQDYWLDEMARRRSVMGGERVGGAIVAALTDAGGGLSSLYEELRPHHRKFLDGEIDADDYDRIKQDVLARIE